MELVDFVGSYLVGQGSSQRTEGGGIVVQPGDFIYVGTGGHQDPPPSNGRVGVSLFSATGQQLLPPSGGAPALFELSGEALVFNGTQVVGAREVPYTIQFSLYRDPEQAFRALYGVTIAGDPDQVAVWGADDHGP